jgi:hypothetical protein
MGKYALNLSDIVVITITVVCLITVTGISIVGYAFRHRRRKTSD